jgi:hypothetical protein
VSIRQETVVYGDVSGFPEGTAPAVGVVVTYVDTNGNHQGETIPLDSQPSPVTLAAGTWTATFQGVDAGGNAVGGVVTDGPFVIVAPTTISLHLPVSASGV